jgi:hypothetical protein
MAVNLPSGALISADSIFICENLKTKKKKKRKSNVPKMGAQDGLMALHFDTPETGKSKFHPPK